MATPAHTHPTLAHLPCPAHDWIDAVAAELPTHDHQYAFVVPRSWLHTLRDRLTLAAAEEFAAEVPTSVRAIFTSEWQPGAGPMKSDAAGYVIRFARAAGIAVQDVPAVARAVTSVARRMLPAGVLDTALDELSPGLQMLLRPRSGLALAG